MSKHPPRIGDLVLSHDKLQAMDLAELCSQPFEGIILALEAVCSHPGDLIETTLTRVLMSDDVATGYGLAPKDTGHRQAPAWCLSLGAQSTNKRRVFYAWSIPEAIALAVKELL